MRLARNIYSMVLVLLFLVPATGFYFSKHTCLQSGEVFLVINGDYDCCSGSDQSAAVHTKSCCDKGVIAPPESCCGPHKDMAKSPSGECSVVEATQTCCINDMRYIKSDEDYTSPDKTGMPQAKSLFLAPAYTLHAQAVNPGIIEQRSKSPPYSLSSSDILNRISVLLI